MPCPDWCSLPAGHSYDSLTNEGLLLRFHETASRGTDAVSIILAAEETATTDQGPVVALAEPRFHLHADDVRPERTQLTGPELRQLAATLLDAADEWDRINAK
jgi:hypothetical protein